MKAFCVLYNPLSSTGTGENKAHRLDHFLKDCKVEYRSLLDIPDKKVFLKNLSGRLKKSAARELCLIKHSLRKYSW